MPIRLRLAVVFALAAAALFALGGWLFASGLSSAQLTTIDSQLAAQLAQAGRYLPAGSRALARRRRLPAGDYVIQVIDPAGRVRGASGDASTTPLLDAGPAEPGAAGPDLGHHGRWTRRARGRGRAAGRPPGLGRRRGRVARGYDATQSQVARELAVGGAVFIALAGLGAYGLARAALSPVERLRRQAAALSERGEEPAARLSRCRPPGTRSRPSPAP